jgi:hypothetical protein
MTLLRLRLIQKVIIKLSRSIHEEESPKTLWCKLTPSFSYHPSQSCVLHFFFFAKRRIFFFFFDPTNKMSMHRESRVSILCAFISIDKVSNSLSAVVF